MEKKRKRRNYINNKDFYDEMVRYRAQEPPRKITNYIGECFLLICNRLAQKSNFNGYTYIEEMISDAIENCIMAVNSFDPNKTNNPFAYFTQIAKFAFIRRIQAEKKQTYIKHKNMINYYLQGETETVELNELSDSIIIDFEAKQLENKLKAAKK